MRLFPTRRPAHGGERGQALVITAMMLVVLVGAMAIAVDLSATTSAHRTLANWSDAAAVAGVRDCDASCDAKTEVQDALQVVLQNSPWSAVSSWPASAPLTSCGVTSCVVTDYQGPPGFSDYLVSVSSPPATPYNAAAYNTTNFVEVDIKQALGTSFAKAIGVPTTRTIGHSIAFDSGPPGNYGYTFFTKREACSGNQSEIIQGDAYLGAGYCNQSNGHADLCVAEVPEPNPDNVDGGGGDIGFDNDIDNAGHAVFSQAPQGVGPAPTYHSDPTLCNTGGAGNLYVQQVSPSAGANCPSGSFATLAGGTWYCVAQSPPLPRIPAPTPTQPAICNATLKSGSTAGVYPVTAGCTVTLEFKFGNIQCISLVLGAGAKVAVNNKKGATPNGAWMTAYGFDGTTDTIAQAAMTNVSGTAQTTACPGSAINNDRTIVWAADPGTLNTTTPALFNGQNGCCSNTEFVGSVYLPDQQVSFGTNQAFDVVGAVYVGDWQVQSGNHPNPLVTYDANTTAAALSVLRITE